LLANFLPLSGEAQHPNLPTYSQVYEYPETLQKHITNFIFWASSKVVSGTRWGGSYSTDIPYIESPWLMLRFTCRVLIVHGMLWVG
jgi:hypothetical protein